MAGCDHALANLFHFRPGKFLAKLRLAEQKALHERTIVHLEIGQHPEFFDCLERHVLDFVYDKDHMFALGAPRRQETLDIFQDRGLVPAFRRKTERARHHPQGVVGAELCRDDIGGNEFALIDLAEKLSDDGCLARAHMAGDGNKAIPLVHAVCQIRHRLFMATARIVEPVIGG